MEHIIAILRSVIAGIIMLLIPKNIRESLMLKARSSKKTLKFLIAVDSTAHETFVVKSSKRNEKIIANYQKSFCGDMQILVKDKRPAYIKRKYKKRKYKKQFQDKQSRINLRKRALAKCEWEISLFKEAVFFTLNDKSLIYNEPFTDRFSINSMLKKHYHSL